MTRKAAAKKQKIQRWLPLAERVFGERRDREGDVAAVGGDHGGGDRRDQHQQRADQRVDDHLQGRRRGTRSALDVAAPGAEEEVERDQHQVEEEDEEQQVLGQEGAQRRGLGDQHPEEEEVGPLLLAEGCERRPGRPDHRGEEDQEDVEAVDAEAVVDAEAGDPGDVDGVLQAGGAGVEAGEDRHRQAERDDRAQHSPPAHQPPRHEEAEEAEDEGCPEDRVAHVETIRK